MSTLTDALYDQYLSQINQVRNELLAHAGFNGVNGPTKVDKETANYYSKVSEISTLFVGAEAAQQEHANNKIKKYYDPTTGTVEKQFEELQALEKPLSQINQEVDQYYTDLNDYSSTLYEDGGFGLSKEEMADKISKYFKDNNVNEFKTGDPNLTKVSLPGDNIPGHDRSVGEGIANQTSFNIGGTQNQDAQVISKSWSRVPKGTIKQLGTPQAPFTERLGEMLEELRKSAPTPGSYKFFIEKLHGKSFGGQFFKKNPIKPGATPIDMPNRMVFPAYISAFNDSYDSSWGDYKFIGRGEKVYTWEETTRSLTLEFYMISDYSADLLLAAIEDARKSQQSKQTNTIDGKNGNLSKTVNVPNSQLINNIKNKVNSKPNEHPIDDNEKLKDIQRVFPDWGSGTSPDSVYLRGQLNGFVPGQISGTPEQLYERATFLAQCMYGWYRKDGKLKEQPFVRVRIGDFFDVICKINSLNLTEDEFDLDLNPSNVGEIPTAIKVSMNMTIVHEDEPSSEYRRFYHRKDYDKEDLNFVPDSGKSTSFFKDGALDNNQSKSPISRLDSLSAHGEGPTDFPKSALAQQEALGNFDKSIQDLGLSSQSLNDVKKRETLKKALTNAKRLLEINQLLDLGQVKDVKGFESKFRDDSKPNISTTSESNTPPTSLFKQADTEKLASKGKLLFPKFKSLTINQDSPKGSF